MFRFPWIKYDDHTKLEIAPVSEIDAKKVIDTDHENEKFFLGRDRDFFYKWYLVGEKNNKRAIIKRLLKKEVGKVVGHS